MFDSSLITYAVSLHFSQKVNEIIISTLQAIADKTENRYYLPDICFPHTTLATRLNQREFSAAEEIAKQVTLPLEAAIEELAVYQCSPFLELKKIGLSR